MARAENQGLQIALIVFVMLTILLAVATFFYVRGYQETMAQNAQLKKSADDATEVARRAQEEINNIKGMLGVDVAMAAEAVKTTFEADMKQFAATLPEDKQHYRDALESLWNTNQEIFEQSTKIQNNFKELQNQYTRREEERDKQIKEFRDKSEEQAKDLVDQRATFESDRQKVHTQREDLLQTVTKTENDKTALAEQSAKQQQALQGEIKGLTAMNERKNEKIRKIQKSEFEHAQGKVVLVNAKDKANGSVYLNLGSADGLVPLVTFSVHDSQANTAQGDGLKARIEVRQILGDHLSVARILDEDLANPIAQDDKVFTSLWQPGHQRHFAILGNIDLDSDGEDDRAVVKDLITSIGGVVDAEMDSLGKVTGEMTINTRYLLEGEIPKDKSAADGATALINRAEVLGVERIPTTKFIELSGWKDQRNVVRFGKNGTRERIPHEWGDGKRKTATSSTEANFQKRRPWRPQKPVVDDADIE